MTASEKRTVFANNNTVIYMTVAKNVDSKLTRAELQDYLTMAIKQYAEGFATDSGHTAAVLPASERGT